MVVSRAVKARPQLRALATGGLGSGGSGSAEAVASGGCVGTRADPVRGQIRPPASAISSAKRSRATSGTRTRTSRRARTPANGWSRTSCSRRTSRSGSTARTRLGRHRGLPGLLDDPIGSPVLTPRALDLARHRVARAVRRAASSHVRDHPDTATTEPSAPGPGE